MKRLVLTAIILLWSGAVFAQTKKVSLSGRIKDSITNHFIEAAVIEVISGTDTLRAVSGSLMGQFIVKNVKPGDAIFRVSHISYKPYEKKIRIQPRQLEPLVIKLEPAAKEIEEVTVKADIPLYKLSGDTLIYNAAAVKTLEGDDAIRIVEQLPGIILNNNSISVLGKSVERTYVDGKLIFGESPMTALLNLTAADVQKIKVYDEYSDYDRRHKLKTGKKHRVLNIETRSKLINAKTGHFLASYGTDMARDNKGELQDRYGVGATANFFSEKLRLSANAYTNNVNRSSNRLDDLLNIKTASQPYAENSYAAVGYEQMFGNEKGVSPELAADYSYKNGYTKTENYSSREYFPTSEYAERLYCDSLYRTRRTATHAARAKFSWKQFHLVQDFSTARDRNRSRQYSLSLLDATSTTANSGIDKQIRSFASNTSVGWMGRLAERWDLNLFATLSYGKNDGTESWTEEGTFQPLRKEYRSSPLGRTHKIQGKASLTYLFPKSILRYIALEYTFDHHYEQSRRLRYDIADGELDMSASRDFTYDYTRHTPLIHVSFRKGLSVIVPLEISIQNQRERLLGGHTDRKRFAAPLPWIIYHLTDTGINSYEFYYKTSTVLPSMEQLSELIDDSNPLYVSSGNPSLRYTYVHEAGLEFNIINPSGGTWLGQASVNFYENAIADRSVFCKDGMTIPGKNGYEVPPGGTFTTYENVSGKMSVSVNVIYNRRVKWLKSRLSLSMNNNYDCTPTYVESRKNMTRSYTPNISIGLNSNFSRQIRFKVFSRNAFIFSWNNADNDNRYFREAAGCSMESNFAKRFFFNVNYEYTLYKPLANAGSRHETNMLNAVAGYKFLKNMGAVSISCYDLLNRSTAFKTTMYSDYVRSGWTPTFGRYWSINVSYRFNKTKSGAKPSSMRLNDGSENIKI